MIISAVFAGKNTIRVVTDLPDGTDAAVSAFIPTNDRGKRTGRCVYKSEEKVKNGAIVFDRRPGYDLAVCAFSVSAFGKELDGVRYVTDFDEDFSLSHAPFFEIKRRIGTWCIAPDEDIEYMRMGVMMDEIDEAWTYSAGKPDDIIHVWNGREYRFDREHTELHDKYLSKLSKKGIPTLIRFIVRKNYMKHEGDGRIFDAIRHPDYESDFDGVEMSAVNLRTEEGFERYCACLDFLFSRYAVPGSPYGYSESADIGNEINSARIWYNAGAIGCAELMEEYTAALRVAWIIAQQYHRGYRVNVSLEMNFTKRFIDDPLHYYPAKECLEHIAEYCRRDGDFGWGVSAHPYPESLEYPDFYNDRQPTFSLDTPIITMKNPEVWGALLRRPEFRYGGEVRRVTFDEQGFNTRKDAPYTEEQGAYAFILEYLKIRNVPEIDAFLINRHIDLDDGDEYGLHLGLRYFGGYEDEDCIFPLPGRRKLICEAIAATDTEREGEWVARAREYIGGDLFDRILYPPEIL